MGIFWQVNFRPADFLSGGFLSEKSFVRRIFVSGIYAVRPLVKDTFSQGGLRREDFCKEDFCLKDFCHHPVRDDFCTSGQRNGLCLSLMGKSLKRRNLKES